LSIKLTKEEKNTLVNKIRLTFFENVERVTVNAYHNNGYSEYPLHFYNSEGEEIDAATIQKYHPDYKLIDDMYAYLFELLRDRLNIARDSDNYWNLFTIEVLVSDKVNCEFRYDPLLDEAHEKKLREKLGG